MPKSSIERLPLHLRTPALRKLSANANAPGGTRKQTGGRPQRPFAQAVQARAGIILIEAVTGVTPLVATVGATNRNLGSGLTNGAITITGTGAAGSPASITTSDQKTLTYGGAGVKDLTAAMAGDPNAVGAARVTV